ncbi:MAG TPA: permease-like cell division protein FtsX [Pseudolysinimonas sp.]|jgi:cell division transport system permease protein|nr:permease-like cell division protein FtsX [Pseudolysinimonas sp.]
MRLGFILSEVGQGFRRNLSMVVSVILVTFISLTFFGAAILLQSQIQQTKGYWYDRAQVAIYLCSDYDTEAPCNEAAATEAQKAAVQAQLDGATLKPYIKKVDFEDRDQAYKNFLDQFAGTTAAQLVTPDILNESFRINLVDPNQAEIIIDQISGMPGVQSVTDQRGLLEPIFALMNAATFTAVCIAGLMLIAAVLLIATTIRLSAFSRRRELGIMRLVGASNRFIETPFILEGVLAALIGSLLAGGVIVALVQFFVQGYLGTQLPGTALVNLNDALLTVPVLLVAGALLAAISASVAIRRYLKV